MGVNSRGFHAWTWEQYACGIDALLCVMPTGSALEQARIIRSTARPLVDAPSAEAQSLADSLYIRAVRQIYELQT